MTLSYYCIATKPREERRATLNLDSQEYITDVYLPLVSGDPKKNEGPKPLFPGYLFLQAEEDGLYGPDWRAIRHTRGVLKILGQGLTPEKVPVEVITRLFEGEIDGLPSPDKDYEPGDRVRVVNGSMAGLEGIYKETSGDKRSIILINILGNLTKVEMEKEQIELLNHDKG